MGLFGRSRQKTFILGEEDLDFEEQGEPPADARPVGRRGPAEFYPELEDGDEQWWEEPEPAAESVVAHTSGVESEAVAARTDGEATEPVGDSPALDGDRELALEPMTAPPPPRAAAELRGARRGRSSMASAAIVAEAMGDELAVKQGPVGHRSEGSRATSVDRVEDLVDEPEELEAEEEPAELEASEDLVEEPAELEASEDAVDEPAELEAPEPRVEPFAVRRSDTVGSRVPRGRAQRDAHGGRRDREDLDEPSVAPRPRRVERPARRAVSPRREQHGTVGARRQGALRARRGPEVDRTSRGERAGGARRLPGGFMVVAALALVVTLFGVSAAYGLGLLSSAPETAMPQLGEVPRLEMQVPGRPSVTPSRERKATTRRRARAGGRRSKARRVSARRSAGRAARRRSTAVAQVPRRARPASSPSSGSRSATPSPNYGGSAGSGGGASSSAPQRSTYSSPPRASAPSRLSSGGGGGGSSGGSSGGEFSVERSAPRSSSGGSEFSVER